MAERKKRQSVIPIIWKTCPHCNQRYDEGNPFASFSHRIGDCDPGPLPNAKRKEGQTDG